VSFWTHRCRSQPSKQFLIVTESATNKVDVVHVSPNGTLSNPVVTSSRIMAALCIFPMPAIRHSRASISNVTANSLPLGPRWLAKIPRGSTNIDIAASDDGRYLCTRNAATGVIGIFAVQEDGSLVNRGPQDGLPASAGINGMAPTNHWPGRSAWDAPAFSAPQGAVAAALEWVALSAFSSIH
jgi:hypothetical protein